MKEPNYHLYLTVGEQHLLLRVLINFKNKLQYEGRYTDAVDEVIYKVAKAKIKKIRIT